MTEEYAKREINRLASYLRDYHGENIGEDGELEATVDVAIRLLEHRLSKHGMGDGE